MKKYSLVIDELTNMSTDEIMADYSRGHHDFDAFKKAVALEHGILIEEVPEPQHEFWRWVPSRRGYYDIEMHLAEAGKKGAFPVTVAYY